MSEYVQEQSTIQVSTNQLYICKGLPYGDLKDTVTTSLGAAVSGRHCCQRWQQWQQQCPDGRLAEVACIGPRPVCKNILGGVGDCHVTAAARIFPLPFW